MESLADAIMGYLKKTQAISAENEEVYRYGILRFVANMINIVTVIIISCALRVGMQGFVYIGMFMLLRKYVGGFHLSSQLKCYIFTTFVIIITLLTIKYVRIDNYVLVELKIQGAWFKTTGGCDSGINTGVKRYSYSISATDTKGYGIYSKYHYTGTIKYNSKTKFVSIDVVY